MADELKETIKRWAHQLGFSLAGVTTPEPPAHLDVLGRWLAAGRHGEMAYMAREDARRGRADPRVLLPECRSILVLAAAYPNPASQGESMTHPRVASTADTKEESVPNTNRFTPAASGEAPARGRVAAYAWGRDYHTVLGERMRELVRLLDGRLGRKIPSRCYVDSGPLLERELAQRAGLGWIGKNTCLINPRAGSYFLLCEVLLGIELEPDTPIQADHCGSCTRCIRACPTACILTDRTVDSRRCVSYLTIELRSEVAAELRPLVGDWIFGCDICQMVCPWNRFAAPVEAGPLSPREGVQHPELKRELALDGEEFARKYGETALRRARRAGFVRNVAVAFGNMGRADDLPALERSLDDPDPIVRTHADWAIHEITERGRRESGAGQ